MSEKNSLDCRGLACPGPVMRVLETLERDAPETLLVQVDDPAARENVTRLLTGKGYAVTAQAAPGHTLLQAARSGPAQTVSEAAGHAAAATSRERTLVFLTADGIGRGSEELGEKLMLAFLGTLPELGPALWRLVLVNGAVKLACQGHPALEKLQALEASGASILVCGTCLGFFGLTEAKRAGQTTNMLDVVTSLGLAEKIIQV